MTPSGPDPLEQDSMSTGQEESGLPELKSYHPALEEGVKDTHVPIRRDTVQAHAVSDEAVLHNRATKEMLALNNTGTAIYRLIDNQRSVADIVSALHDRFDVALETLRESVSDLLSDLVKKEFITLRRSRSSVTIIDPLEPVRVGFDDTQVEIYTDLPEAAEWIRRRFKMLIQDKPAKVTKRIGLSKMGHYFHISGCRRGNFVELSWFQTRRVIKHEIDRKIVDANRDYIWFHAGAVSKGDFAILFGGNYGAGKSTTICKLYEQGWTYHSDDIIPVNPHTMEVHSFPMTPMYRVSELDELLDEGGVSELKRVVVDLDEDRVATQPVPVGAFVFPKFTPGKKAVMNPLSPSQALVELMKHTLNYRVHGQDGLEQMAAMMDGKEVYILEYGDGEEVADLVEKTFGIQP